jgi:acyl carrier protein
MSSAAPDQPACPGCHRVPREKTVADHDEIFERLANVVADTLKVERESITPESRFTDDLKADSLDMLTLLMQLEDEFGNTIPDEDAKTFTTVGAVLDYIREKTPQAGQ